MTNSIAEYFIMENSVLEDGGLDCLHDGVSNEHGEFLNPAFGNEEVTHAYALKRHAKPIGDWIAIVGGWLALTDRAAQVIRCFSVCSSVRGVPLAIHDRRKHSILEGTLLYGPKHWDVLDLLQSKYEYFKGTDVIRNVTKWVFRPNDVPPFDLFYTRQLRWIASSRLREAIKEAKLKGFTFLSEGEEAKQQF